jgi:hypothetical protein
MASSRAEAELPAESDVTSLAVSEVRSARATKGTLVCALSVRARDVDECAAPRQCAAHWARAARPHRPAALRRGAPSAVRRPARHSLTGSKCALRARGAQGDRAAAELGHPGAARASAPWFGASGHVGAPLCRVSCAASAAAVASGHVEWPPTCSLSCGSRLARPGSSRSSARLRAHASKWRGCCQWSSSQVQPALCAPCTKDTRAAVPRSQKSKCSTARGTTSAPR